MSPRAAELPCQVVLPYVANQLSMYDWPAAAQVMSQYTRLMQRWSQLLEEKDIASSAWLPRPKLKSPCFVAGRSESPRFSWTYWWKTAHTDRRFCPTGCEAAFALFHFTGMLGVSEAQAESVASLLKRYSPKCSSTLATDRIIEKTLLRCSGVQGDGSDDRLLLRAWAEIFGGIQRNKFTFEYRDRLRRIQLYPLGGGSMVLNRHLKKSQLLRKRWSLALLRALPRIGNGKATATNKWLRFLNRRS